MSVVKYEIKGQVGVITIDNPPINLTDDAVMSGLQTVLDLIDAQPPRALMLQAAGEHFGCGVNVNTTFVGVDGDMARKMLGKAIPLATRMEEMQVPIVAAVQGFCFAAALEFALRCDIIFAARSATFAQVEQHIGAATYLGGAYLLSERCGPARAREICFTGANYTAETFERWNIVNYVVDDAELHAKAFAFAQKVAAGPTRAHAVTKRLVRQQLDVGTRAADGLLLDIGAPLFDTEDFQAGVAGIVEHGSRNFRGKVQFQGK